MTTRFAPETYTNRVADEPATIRQLGFWNARGVATPVLALRTYYSHVRFSWDMGGTSLLQSACMTSDPFHFTPNQSRHITIDPDGFARATDPNVAGYPTLSSILNDQMSPYGNAITDLLLNPTYDAQEWVSRWPSDSDYNSIEYEIEVGAGPARARLFDVYTGITQGLPCNDLDLRGGLELTTGVLYTEEYNSAAAKYLPIPVGDPIPGLVLRPNSTNRLVVVTGQKNYSNTTQGYVWIALNGTWLQGPPTYPREEGSGQPGRFNKSDAWRSMPRICGDIRIRVVGPHETAQSTASVAANISWMATGSVQSWQFVEVATESANHAFDIGQNGRIGASGGSYEFAPLFSDDFGRTWTYSQVDPRNREATRAVVESMGYAWGTFYVGNGSWLFSTYSDSNVSWGVSTYNSSTGTQYNVDPFTGGELPPISYTGFHYSHNNLDTYDADYLTGVPRGVDPIYSYSSPRAIPPGGQSITDTSLDGVFSQGIRLGPSTYKWMGISYFYNSATHLIHELEPINYPYDGPGRTIGYTTTDSGQTWNVTELVQEPSVSNPFDKDFYVFGNWSATASGAYSIGIADRDAYVAVAYTTDLKMRTWEQTPIVTPIGWTSFYDLWDFDVLPVTNVGPTHPFEDGILKTFESPQRTFHNNADSRYRDVILSTPGLIAYWPLDHLADNGDVAPLPSELINGFVSGGVRVRDYSIVGDPTPLPGASNTLAPAAVGPVVDGQISGGVLGMEYASHFTIPASRLQTAKMIELWINTEFNSTSGVTVHMYQQNSGWQRTTVSAHSYDYLEGWKHLAMDLPIVPAQRRYWTGGVLEWDYGQWNANNGSVVNSPAFNPAEDIIISVRERTATAPNITSSAALSGRDPDATNFNNGYAAIAEIALYDRIPTFEELREHFLVGVNKEVIRGPVTPPYEVPFGFVPRVASATTFETTPSVSGSYEIWGTYLPATFTVTAGTTPPGLTINADGTYSGAYTTPGTYTWTTSGTDGNGVTLTSTASTTVYSPVWGITYRYVGNGYHLYTLNDAGTPSKFWKRVGLLPSGGHGNNCVYRFGNAMFYTHSSVTYRSADFGATWSQIASLTDAMSSMWQATNGNIIAVPDNSSVTPKYSTDGGLTFTSITLPAGATSGSNDRFAVRGNIILVQPTSGSTAYAFARSVDGGGSFQYPFPTPTTDQIVSFKATSDYFFALSHSYAEPFYGVSIKRSTDGAAWESLTLPSSLNIASPYQPPSSRVFMTSPDGKLVLIVEVGSIDGVPNWKCVYSSNHGTTWQDGPLPVPLNEMPAWLQYSDQYILGASSRHKYAYANGTFYLASPSNTGPTSVQLCKISGGVLTWDQSILSAENFASMHPNQYLYPYDKAIATFTA